VIGGLHTFQVNDGEIVDVYAVYSNGSALTQVASSPTPGQYAVDRSNGTFQLGGSTLNTIITCDVYGMVDNRSSPSIYLSRAGEIIEYVASVVAGVASVNQASISQLDTGADYELGLYINSQETCASVIEKVINSVGAFYSFNRSLELFVGRISVPTGDPVQSFDSVNIFDIKKVATVRPAKQVVLGYGRAWRVHNLNEIADTVPDAKRQFLVEEFRTVVPSVDTSAVVENHFPLASEERYDTLICSQSDAQTEVDRLQDLYQQPAKIYEVMVNTQPFALELGDVVSIEDDRFGLTPARKYVLIGLAEDAQVNRITLTVWGF
jgi:hypothetical protein